jgi:hypothetical protein
MVVLLVLFLIGCVFVVRFLGGGAARGSSAEASIEENWIRTIKNLGVNPIFPPEEDLVVGDILAVVVRDVDIDSHEQTNTIAKRALITRAVKLAHVDAVANELDLAYGGLPVFPDVTKLPGLDLTKTPLSHDAVARAFTKAVALNNLPRAAFPRLRITGVNSAAAGAAGGNGSASYGASSQQEEEFELSEVRTYGLPSVTALTVFDRFCAENADVCEEATARKHLENIIGPHVNLRFTDPKSGEYRYAMEVQVLMVYRVYLTSSIIDVRRTAASQKGGLAWWQSASSQDTASGSAPAPDPAPASATTLDGGMSQQVQALNTRIAGLEQRLSKAKTGGTLMYGSSYGNESSLEGKFERPVAIAYRSVKHEFAPVKPSQPAQ